MDSRLYADMLLNRCDATMKLPLEAIDNLHDLGEERLWDKIESIYKDSNPIFVRRNQERGANLRIRDKTQAGL